jgi:hypothetical protein
MTPLEEPVDAEGTAGHLPVWVEGFTWSYYVDHDVDYYIDTIHIDHISENWTRTHYKTIDVAGKPHYQIWEERRGLLHGTIQYIVPISITATAFGSGWTFIRASDMALVNQSFNLTFSGDLPLGQGKFTGGFNNFTTFDPPLPMMEFPITSVASNFVSTVNTTTLFFILQPSQYAGAYWYNTSEVWDIDITATGTTPMTVPAGTYDAYQVHEVGTRYNTTDSWPVNRTWYYADDAVNAIRTFESHELVWTDAYYTPPNLPPVGPDGPVELVTDEDTPLDIDMSTYFSDPDGDDLNYHVDLMGDSVVNATLDRKGTVWTVSPKANWSGRVDIWASVKDPFQSEAASEFVVRVLPVNDGPYVAWEPHDVATEEDTPIMRAHDLAQVFADIDGDQLAFYVNSTEGVVVFRNGTTIDLLPGLDWTGRATITMTATDPSGEEATTSFDLLVGEVNDDPTIVSSGGPARIHEVEEGEFWVVVVDMDSPVLEYAWYVDGFEVGGESGDTFSYAPGDLTVSRVTVSVTVKDDWNAQATVSWNVTILDSPWIVSVGPRPGSFPWGQHPPSRPSWVTLSCSWWRSRTPTPSIRPYPGPGMGTWWALVRSFR